MATRDFKVRNGLEVGGDITYKGGTITVFDSESVINIVKEVGNNDSDLAVVAALREDIDSDSSVIQSLQGEIDILRSDADSDSTIIQQLRTDHDTLNQTVSGHTTDIQTINNILDSDETAIQLLDNRVDNIDSDLSASGISNGFFQYNGTGARAKATSSGAIAIGANSVANNSNTIAIGRYSQGKVSSVSLGNNAQSDTRSVAIGDSAKTGQWSVAIGQGSAGLSTGNIAIGRDADVDSDLDYSGVIGYGARATQPNQLVLGGNSDSTGFTRISVGYADYNPTNDSDLVTVKYVTQNTLDSDNVIDLINNNVTGMADSDLAVVHGLREDVDSDSAVIQSLAGRIDILETNADSDVIEIGHLRRDADSDASEIARLRADADSDSTAIQALQESFSSDITTLQNRADSDETKIQSLGTDIETIQTRLDSDETQLQTINTRIDNLGGNTSIQVSVFTFTAANNEDSDFSGADDNGQTLSYVVNKIHVYLNGILQTSGTDYTATDGSTVTFVDPPDSDDVISIVKYLGTVQAGFDSDQVVAIIGENTSADVEARLDSDELAIQALRTDIEGKIDDVNTDYSSQATFTLDEFATGDYRSVKYFISADSNDSSYMATEVIVIHDDTNAYITEYGTVSTHDSEFITLDADISGGNVRLRATPTNGAGNVKAIRQHINHT